LFCCLQLFKAVHRFLIHDINMGILRSNRLSCTTRI